MSNCNTWKPTLPFRHPSPSAPAPCCRQLRNSQVPCAGGRPDLELVFGGILLQDAGSFREWRAARVPAEEEGGSCVCGWRSRRFTALRLREGPLYSAFCVRVARLSVWDGVLRVLGMELLWSRVQGPQSPSTTAAVCASLQDSPPRPRCTMPSAQVLSGRIGSRYVIIAPGNVFCRPKVVGWPCEVSRPAVTQAERHQESREVRVKVKEQEQVGSSRAWQRWRVQHPLTLGTGGQGVTRPEGGPLTAALKGEASALGVHTALTDCHLLSWAPGGRVAVRPLSGVEVLVMTGVLAAATLTLQVWPPYPCSDCGI